MFNLFYCEFKRYQYYAIIFSILALTILTYYSSISPFVAKGPEVDVYIVLTILVSFGFSATQMLLHKRKNHWAYLIHRPIAAKKLHHALTSAGCLLLTVAVILPILIILTGLDLLNIALVEQRHYLFILHLAMTAYFVYFIGVYTVLNANKGAILSIALLYYIISSREPSSAVQTLTTDIVSLLVVFYLSKQSFKANLSQHFTKKRDITLATTAMHFAIVGLLFMSQAIFYHLPLALMDDHPDNYSQEQLKDYYASLWQLEPNELAELVVDENIYPNKATLIKQLELATEQYIKAGFQAQPFLGQVFHHDKSYAFEDKKNKVRWTFSHQEQLFIGDHLVNKKRVGYFDRHNFYPAGTKLKKISQKSRFKSVPNLSDNKFLRTKNTIYVVDFDEQYIEVKHQLADDEYYTQAINSLRKLPSIALLSNKALYLFNKQSFEQENSMTEPDMVIKHYREIVNPQHINLTSVIDGYIVSYASSSFFGFEQSGTGLVYAKFDGSRTLLGEKSFKKYRPLPNFINHQYELMSPLVAGIAFNYLTSQAKGNNDPDHLSLKEIIQLPYPRDVYYYAFGCWLLSMLLTWMLAIKIKLPRSRQLFWLSLVAVFSLPGLVSFLLLNKWRTVLFSKNQNKKHQSITKQTEQDRSIIASAIK